MPDIIRKIPTLDIKLSGASTYPEWVVSIEAYLDLIPIQDTGYRVWDIIVGNYTCPTKADIGEASKDSNADKATREWKDGNEIALLKMRKSCEDEIRARIGNLTSANEAYAELRKAYEGKTATEFYALRDSLTLSYDDRKCTIEEHITAYERVWNYQR